MHKQASSILNCDNILVNFVSQHAVFYSRMCSGMGRNVQYYCERFGVCAIDVICSSKQLKSHADVDMDIRAGMIHELVMIKDGIVAFFLGCFCI